MKNEIKNKLIQLEEYAMQNYVPIIKHDALDVLNYIIKHIKPKKVLEIGTAIAYSSVNILNSYDGAFLTTIEKNAERVKVARCVFDGLKLSNRVKLIENDAYLVLEEFVNKNEKFDFIFLDGPKAQYLKYFKLIKQLLNENGIVFCDNINYNNYVFGGVKPEKKFKTIAKNLKEFYNYIINDGNLIVKVYNASDGVATIELKKKIII